ncbi:unnamed protein product [Bubo scandiacus]
MLKLKLCTPSKYLIWNEISIKKATAIKKSHKFHLVKPFIVRDTEPFLNFYGSALVVFVLSTNFARDLDRTINGQADENRDSWGKDHYGHQTVPRLIAEKEWEALTLQLNRLSAMEVKDILSLDDEVLSKIHQFYFIQVKLSCASHLPTGHSPAATWANGRQMASPSVALHAGNLLQWCRIVIYQNKTKSRGIFSWQIYFFKRTWSWGMKKPLTLPHFSRILNANRKPTSLLKGICCACFSKDEKYLYTGLLDQSITAWDVASDGFIVITKLSYRIREKFHCPKTTPPRYNPLQNIEALCMVKSRNTDRENSSKQQHNQADSSRSLTYTSKPSSICSVV